MIDRRFRSLAGFLLLALSLSVVAGAAGALALEGDEPKKDEPKKEGEAREEPRGPTEEEVKEYVKTYEDTLKKMTDADAIAGVGRLHAFYVHPGADDDVKKEVLGAFKKVVDQRGRDALVEAAAKALGDFGEDAVNLLKYVVDRAMNQKVPAPGVVRAGLASLGKIANPKPADVKFLTDLLKKDDEFIGDAARALAGYAKGPGVLRRDICEELLKMSEGVFSKSEGNDAKAKQRWNTWGTEVVEAMQKVSRTNFTKPPEFRKWLNEKGEGGGKNPRTWADPEGAR